MLTKYKKFLEELDRELRGYFSEHQEYLKCKKGCTDCCESGEYPFSRLEAEYLMYGFVNLPKEIKSEIRKNIAELKILKNKFKGERFLYKCPFLVNNACTLYERRGIVCRTFGLAYLKEDNTIKLPNCTNLGLNYAEIYNPKTGEIFLENPIKKELSIDKILRNKDAENLELECGEIRPLIDWF